MTKAEKEAAIKKLQDEKASDEEAAVPDPKTVEPDKDTRRKNATSVTSEETMQTVNMKVDEILAAVKPKKLGDGEGLGPAKKVWRLLNFGARKEGEK